MRRRPLPFLFAVLLLSISLLVGCGKQASTPMSSPPPSAGFPQTIRQATDGAAVDRTAAEKAARAWLALVDAGKYAASWKAAGTGFQKTIGRDFWAQTAQVVRAPFGKLQAREVMSADAGPGGAVVVQYHSAFAKQRAAVETVTLERDATDGWKVTGYSTR